MISHWSQRYVGIPQRDLGRDLEGCDCYGLVWLVYLMELGIELPSYAGSYVSPDERAEIAALISGAQMDGSWRLVDGALRDFDVLLFRRGAEESHIGLVAGPNRMLHMRGIDAAVVERWDTPQHERKFTGAWRHVRMAELQHARR